MIFSSDLISGHLIKRYKRFLADIKLDNGTVITAYCPNTGSMKSCSAPGSPVMLSLSGNNERKYPHTLEMVGSANGWIGVNTGLTNTLVAEAIENNQIVELTGYEKIQREITVTKGTRLDILLSKGDDKVFIEVKNCSLVEGATAMFPDAVTARGTKHLEKLAECVEKGDRGVIFYLVQRMDAERFKPAEHIDELYSKTLKRVYDQGVEILAYQAEVTPKSITVTTQLPFEL